jgi:tyrosinase
MTVAYVGGSHSPHCLTRDFGSNLSFHETPKQLSPSAVEALLSEDDYYKFLVNFEATTHVAIPKFIMGDFRFSTSPNDPIFFLHHAQVDRVWWQWQMYSLDRRLAYGGKFKAKESKLASPDDAISIGGLAPDIKVRDIMDVRSGLLCYRY